MFTKAVERNIVLYYGIESSVQERLGRHPLLSPLLKPTRTNVMMASLPRLSDISICHHTKKFDIKDLSRRFCSHYSHPPPFQLVEILPTILPPRLACQTCQPRHLHGASRFQAHLIFDIFGRTIFCLKICAQKLHKFQHNLYCHARDCIFYKCFSDKKGNIFEASNTLVAKELLSVRVGLL